MERNALRGNQLLSAEELNGRNDPSRSASDHGAILTSRSSGTFSICGSHAQRLHNWARYQSIGFGKFYERELWVELVGRGIAANVIA
jgi:hypothetical protein